MNRLLGEWLTKIYICWLTLKIALLVGLSSLHVLCSKVIGTKDITSYPQGET